MFPWSECSLCFPENKLYQLLRFRLSKSYKSFRQPAFIENKKHLAQLLSTNFASNIKQIQAIELISNLHDNKSNLNKVKISYSIWRNESNRKIFLDATQLDQRMVSLLSQKLVQKSQCIPNIYFLESIFHLKMNSAIWLNYQNDDLEKLEGLRKNGGFTYILCQCFSWQ